MCIKVKQARVLQPDPRSSEDCNTLLHEGFANEGFAKDCNIAIVLYVPYNNNNNNNVFILRGLHIKYKHELI